MSDVQGAAPARGVFSPVVTPFDAELRPDAQRFVRHCRWLLDQGVGPGQVVIAGDKEAVERAVRAAAKRGGIKGVMLPVSAPFHSALMKPAADRLAAELVGVPMSPPRIRVVRNVDAGLTTSADEVKPFLVQQVASPVRWTDCVERLRREGAAIFFEVGPGRVLTGLLKRTLTDVRGHAVEDPASLDKALEAVAAAGGAAS